MLAGTLVAALWLVPPHLGWDRYRARLVDLASAGLGRPVAVNGLINLVLLPQPTLTASEVIISDAGDGASATVGEMRLQVALRPLLGGRVEVTDLVLDQAAMRLRWPPAAMDWRAGPDDAAGRAPPGWLTRLHARIEDSALQVGGLSVTGIDGEISLDPETGTLQAAGLAGLMGRRWRVVGRLGQAGGDGSATLDVSIDGQGETLDTGATLSGQIAADGSLGGTVKARGSDLSLLLPAPAASWRASGRIVAGGGLMVASDLDVDIGGSPALGAVALRVLPAPRLDAALAASRLDLDAWLPALLRGGGPLLPTTLPTALDLSAEQASLAGGTLRRVRAGLELTAGGVAVRDAEAVLPGAAALHLTGQVTAGRFQGEGRLDATALAETRRWLRPQAPELIDALPAAALHSASVSARVAAGYGMVSLEDLAGRIDGAVIAGVVALRPGEHPALAATLRVSGLPLDAWLPAVPPDLPALALTLAGLPQRWAGFDLDLELDASRPTLHGVTFDALAFATRSRPGAWDVKRATLTGRGLTASASFKMASDGTLGDGQAAASVASVATLAPWLPWLPPAWQGPATIRATVAGDPAALGISLAAEIADARVEAAGRGDLARRRWSGSVSAHHPGATRLLDALGVPGAAGWLGDGSMSLLAQAELTPGRLTLKDAELVAGALRTRASVSLDTSAASPELTGEITAEDLPLPLPDARSLEPLPLAALAGWRAHVAAHAAAVLFGLAPTLGQADATVTIADGGVRVDAITAELAGGHLGGAAALQPGGPAEPPWLDLQATAQGVGVGSLFAGVVPGLAAGRLDGRATLHAAGYSPAALLATVSGEASATVQDGVLAGVDLAGAAAALRQADAALAQAQSAAALAGGSTPFTRLDLAATVERGGATLREASLASPAGAIAAAGLLDFPARTEDLRLTLQPRSQSAMAGPRLDVRLIGPAAAPRRAAGLADLTRYLSEQQAAPQ